MLDLFIAISAAALGALAAIVGFVAWAVRREDAHLSLADPAASPVISGVRRLLGLHVMGITGPARLDPTDAPRIERIGHPSEPARR